jgi:hypothetical protein
MRRTLPLALLALALAPAAAGAADPPAIAPGEPNPAAPVAVDWRLDQAGRDALSLDLLAFGSSSCLPGSLTAAVVETRARIEISVRSTRPRDQVCTADYAPTPLTVRLSAPPRGRLVVGPRRLRSDPLDGRAPGRRRVPRVTGLAPRDAVAVVRQHGLTPQLERVADLRSRPRVIGQTPASGRAAARRAPVTLFVSR